MFLKLFGPIWAISNFCIFRNFGLLLAQNSGPLQIFTCNVLKRHFDEFTSSNTEKSSNFVEISVFVYILEEKASKSSPSCI